MVCPPSKPWLIAKTIEDPLRPMALLPGDRLIVAKNAVDNARERVQLRSSSSRSLEKDQTCAPPLAGSAHRRGTQAGLVDKAPRCTSPCLPSQKGQKARWWQSFTPPELPASPAATVAYFCTAVLTGQACGAQRELECHANVSSPLGMPLDLFRRLFILE